MSNTLINFLSQFDPEMVAMWSVGFGVFYLLISSQRMIKKELKTMQAKLSQPRTIRCETVSSPHINSSWMTLNIRGLNSRIRDMLRDERSGRMAERYAQDFVPLLRLTALFKQYGEDALERFEKTAEMAVNCPILQRELVLINAWFQFCGVDISANRSELFKLCLKRFEREHRARLSAVTPKKILDDFFTEFDPRSTLAGDHYKLASQYVAKLADNFIHKVSQSRLSTSEAAVLLSLMPGSRVALFLDILPERRLKSVSRKLSKVTRTLNPRLVENVIRKVAYYYSPIHDGRKPTDIDGYFREIAGHLSQQKSTKFLANFSTKKQQAAQPNQKMLPPPSIQSARPSLALRTQERRPTPPGQPINRPKYKTPKETFNEFSDTTAHTRGAND